jgi:hypothetical protein
LRAGDRENVAKGVVGDALTVPEIVEPLLATNDTDAPAICDDVTITTCVPALGDSVHFTDDLPSLSVVVAVADSVPPFVAAQVSATPDTDLPAASTTCTTSAESSGAERSPDWFAPETILMVVGVCGIGVWSWHALKRSAAMHAAAEKMRADIRRTGKGREGKTKMS